MRCAYNLIRSEIPRLQELLALSTMATMAPNANLAAIKLCSGYQFAYALMLGVASVLNYIIRIFDRDSSLAVDAHELIDESISLAHQCASRQLTGAMIVPDYLKTVWASTTDSYRSSEIEAILFDYKNTDLKEGAFMEEALEVKGRLQRTAMAQSRAETVQEASNADESSTHDALETSECTIM